MTARVFARILAAILVVLAALAVGSAEAGFRTPESLVRNVCAYYGDRSSGLSSGLPRDAATARQFFDHSLQAAWSTSRVQPYDFMVKSPTWKVGAVSISILRRQFDRTYVAVAFDNHGRAVTLNFVLVNGPEGWVILDIESPRDSLRMFLAQYRNKNADILASGQISIAGIVRGGAAATHYLKNQDWLLLIPRDGCRRFFSDEGLQST